MLLYVSVTSLQYPPIKWFYVDVDFSQSQSEIWLLFLRNASNWYSPTYGPDHLHYYQNQFHGLLSKKMSNLYAKWTFKMILNIFLFNDNDSNNVNYR